jgi:hypothetical protein
MGKTRATIRSEAAVQVGDKLSLTASAGSTSTIRDDQRLTEESNAYAGADIVFTSGPVGVIGESRYVLSSDQGERTLNFDPALSIDVPVGTTADLFNLFGMGVSLAEWNEFINIALSDAAEKMAEVPKSVLLGTFASSSDWGWSSIPYAQTMTIPTSIKKAGPVSYVLDGHTYYPQRGAIGTGEGWHIDEANRVLVIHDDLAAEMDGALVYMRGFGPPDPLEADDDETDVPTVWLYPKLKALAYGRMKEKGLVDHRATETLWEGVARDKERMLKPAHYPPNTVKLWG